MFNEKNARQSLSSIRDDLKALAADNGADLPAIEAKLQKIIEAFDKTLILLDNEQHNFNERLKQQTFDNQMSKESVRTTQPIKPPDHKGPHHIEG
jgi:hypothetical protein